MGLVGITPVHLSLLDCCRWIRCGLLEMVCSFHLGLLACCFGYERLLSSLRLMSETSLGMRAIAFRSEGTRTYLTSIYLNRRDEW